MSKYANFRDIFDPSKRDEVLKGQGELIEQFKEISRNMSVLQGQDEVNALPDLITLTNFMTQLVGLEDIMEVFNQYPDLSNYLMDHLFKDLNQLILKVGLFPNSDVLEYTAKFLELHMIITLRVIHRGFVGFMKAPENILAKGRRQFYCSNTSKCDPHFYPFGDKLGDIKEFTSWVEKLEVGQQIDAIKYCKNETKAIWSRAEVVEITSSKIYVKFLNVNDAQHLHTSVSITPFSINQLATRSLDFEWRQGLKKGDLVDLYLGRRGWLLFEITEHKDVEASDQTVRLISCKLAEEVEDVFSSDEEAEDFDITINVNDPYLRAPSKYSKKRFVSTEYCFDDIYEPGHEEYYAVFRGKFESMSSRKDVYINSKYFIRFINVFCMEGGLNLLKERIEKTDEPCSADFVGAFMGIIESIGPYLLNRTIEKYADQIINTVTDYMLKSPLEVAKTFSSDIINNVYNGIQYLARRLYPITEATEIYESFYLKIAVACIKTDFLERKMNGVTFLGQIYKQIKSKEFTHLTKRELVQIIEDENIIEQIIKGHPQLITKSNELLKLVFDEDKMSEKNMTLLWNTLRKGDLETRKSLLSILNSIYFELSYKNMEFLINQIKEVDPKQVMPDEIELAFKFVNFSKYKSDCPTDPNVEPLSDKVVKVFWKIATYPDMTNPELTKNAIERMTNLMRQFENQELEIQIVDEALENLKKGIAVIQSLKIIKRILKLYEKVNKRLLEHVLAQDVVTQTFESLKKIKADVRAAAQKNNNVITEANVNQLLNDKIYNFETHVLKRLGFIEFIMSSGTQDKEAVLNSIHTIWEELVENSVVDIEIICFKKWLKGLSDKEGQTIITRDILLEFFNQKITVLFESKTSKTKHDILMIFIEVFLKLNLMDKSLTQVVVRMEEEHSYTSTEKLVVTKNPESLDGIQSLWLVILKSKEDSIVGELMNLVTNLYLRPELDKIDTDDQYIEYTKTLVDKCIKIYEEQRADPSFESDEHKQKTACNMISMICDVIDKTESKQSVKNVSLSSFYRGKAATATVENKISISFNTPKNIDVKIAGNTTIQQMKMMISKEIRRTSWKNIKLLRGYKKIEIPDKYNSRNLRDLEISLAEKFTSEFRPAPIMKPEPLIIESGFMNMVNPKAITAFKMIFNTFAQEGKMYPEQLVKFCEGALDEKNLDTNYHQIKDLLAKYDNDKKGYLAQEDFVRFYSEACHSKSTAVMQNLRNLNFNDQLEYNDEQVIDQGEELVRDYVLSKTGFIDDVYSATEKGANLAKKSWDLLSRLPPIPSILERLLKLENVKDQEEPQWSNIIDSHNTFKTLYNLYIIDFLLDDTKVEEVDNPLAGYIQEDLQEFKKAWRKSFIQFGGFQYLFGILKDFVHKGVTTQNDILLFSFIMKAVKTYLLADATIDKPELYANIAFISSNKIPFSALLKRKTGGEPASVEVSPENKTESPKKEQASQGDMMGPKTETEARKETGTATEGENTSSKQENEKDIEALTEKPEFIEFRESLKLMKDEGIKSINTEETLRFLIRLCESTLVKTENQHFDELSIIELSLSIIFCLILSDTELLRKLVVSGEIKLLSENSQLKLPGQSDFISFLVGGLLTKRGFMFIKFFDNAFKILLREGGSAEVQSVLVKVIFENALKDDLSLRSSARHIELAVLLLESICSEHKDEKIFLTKSDVNKIVDLQSLFFNIYQRIFTIKPPAKEDIYYMNELIIGYFKLMEKVLVVEPKTKQIISESKDQVIGKVFNECLFNSPESTSTKEIVCKNYFTRTAAFELLVELCRGCPANLKNLQTQGLSTLSKNLPKISSWGYTSTHGRRSDLGFVGIYNLSCICYMNAMLQQFYMTPTFRYGLLMANDHKEENIVGEKKIDDNLFHQLQKMFAFLDRSERRDYNPTEFCFSYKDQGSDQPINVTIQQDTKEFLDVFFDRLENTLKPTPFKNLLYDVYGGKQINLIECSNCGNLRTTEEIFYNLSLEVKNLKNINEGIEKMITEDIISDYKCESCQQRCDVSKRTLIKECPNVLIVHLQRIIFDLDVLMNVKINSWYEFPQHMDLKDYTYESYKENTQGKKEQDKESGDMDSTPLETKDSEATESSQLESEPINPEAKGDNEESKKTSKDNNYEYNLAGVIVHLGSAEVGHYYSYINVNRNDPSRPKIVEDKWIEFNDSTIRNFKLSDLEEECFGSKEEAKFSRFDDDYDYLVGGGRGGGRFSIDKCAYILVYEKVEKGPLTFDFDRDNIAEKDLIISNIKEEKQATVEFKKNEDGTSRLTTGFYDFNPFLPPKLANVVKDDNFKFMIEQHVYSKEFLNFISAISDLKDVPDFVAHKLPDRIYKGEVDPEFKKVVGEFLDSYIAILLDVYSKTEDNQSITKFALSISRMVSICHERASEILRYSIFPNLPQILTILTDCPDALVRKALCDIISHLVLVAINSEGIKIKISEKTPVVETADGLTSEEVIKVILKKMLAVFKVEKKDTTYKKLRGYFKMWLTIVSNSDQLAIWLVRKMKITDKLVGYYMDKKPSPYEVKNDYNEHEKAVEPILETLVRLTQIVFKVNAEVSDQDSPDHINYQLITPLTSSDLYDKIIGENFLFNSYQSLKDLISIFCFKEFLLSKYIIMNCLRNFTHYSEKPHGYLEALKELCMINDQYTQQRLNMILGFPTILDTKVILNKIMFGFQVNKDLNMPAIRYRSPLNFAGSSSSLLKIITDAKDKSEGNGFIYLAFLLEMMLASPAVFEYVIHMPSPYYMYANYHDWFAVFIKEYINNRDNYHSIYDTNKAVLYEKQVQEHLRMFEDRYLKYIAENYPEQFKSGEYTILPQTASGVYGNTEEHKEMQAYTIKPERPILSLSKTLIVGATIKEELVKSITLYHDNSDRITMNIYQILSLAAPSRPTGETNLALPSYFKKKANIFGMDITNGSALQTFVEGNDAGVKNKDSEFKMSVTAPDGVTESKNLIDITSTQTGAKSFVKAIIPPGALGEENMDEPVKMSADSGSRATNETAATEPLKGKQYITEESAENSTEFDMEFFRTYYILKMSITNNTSSGIAFAIKLTPGEKCNLYLPNTEFNVNVKDSKVDQQVIYLMKKDPTLPFGDFTVSTIFNELGEHENFYVTNSLEFDDDVQPFSCEVDIPASPEDQLAKPPNKQE